MELLCKSPACAVFVSLSMLFTSQCGYSTVVACWLMVQRLLLRGNPFNHTLLDEPAHFIMTEARQRIGFVPLMFPSDGVLEDTPPGIAKAGCDKEPDSATSSTQEVDQPFPGFNSPSSQEFAAALQETSQEEAEQASMAEQDHVEDQRHVDTGTAVSAESTLEQETKATDAESVEPADAAKAEGEAEAEPAVSSPVPESPLAESSFPESPAAASEEPTTPPASPQADPQAAAQDEEALVHIANASGIELCAPLPSMSSWNQKKMFFSAFLLTMLLNGLLRWILGKTLEEHRAARFVVDWALFPLAIVLVLWWHGWTVGFYKERQLT